VKIDLAAGRLDGATAMVPDELAQAISAAGYEARVL
jgi:hypothetical protein